MAQQSKDSSSSQGKSAEQNSTNLKARATEAGEASINLTMSKVKFGLALDAGATSETGAGALASFYFAIGATGNAVAGAV